MPKRAADRSAILSPNGQPARPPRQEMGGGRFDLQAPFSPMGDQPRAIAEMLDGLERGEKHQTLLGATGTGKSVGYDDPVYVVERDGTGARVRAIGPLVDRYFAKAAPEEIAKHGDSDVLSVPPGRLQTLSLDPETGQAALHDVSALTRHAPTTTMYAVETGCGRTITLTGDHNLWVLREGRLRLIETAEALPTDYLPVPQALLSPPESITHGDVLGALTETPLRIRAHEAVLDLVDRRGTNAVATALRDGGVTQPYGAPLGMRAGRGSLPRAAYSHLAARLPSLDHRSVKIGGAQNPLPARLHLTPLLLRLIGYYVAEGAHTKCYVVLSNYDEAIRRDIEAGLRALDLPIRERPSSDYQIGSVAFASLMAAWCGTSSRTKRLPPFWPSLADDGLGNLLRAYFDGDGTVGHASDVTATTASEALASDLTYALLRFGIGARIRTKTKRATNSDHAGDTYFEVVVSGQDDLARFAEHVGFGLARKQSLLDAALHDRGNTNVDIVPIAGADLRVLRQGLGLFQRDLAEFGGVSRSAVQTYETETRRPARSVLRAILAGLRQRAHAQSLDDVAWWERLRAVDALCGVRWTPVARVEPTDYAHRYVYDFTVPGPETFLAGHGGMFVHNTFSVSNVIAQAGKPTLVMSHNKTLAAQLYAEFKSFFPDNAVEFFISYYDYYQPEAYIVHSDTYIEKDMAINDQIDRLRLRATSALVSGREDVIVVASVSCIYGLGSPEEYKKQIVQLTAGQEIDRNELLHAFIGVFYERNDIEFEPGRFRVRGDVVELFPAYLEEIAYRITFWGDEIEALHVIDPLTGEVIREEKLLTIYPAKIFVTPEDQMERAIKSIEEELRWRLAVLREEGFMLEAQRLEQRTRFDIEMMKEIGFCSGIENYSRHLTGHAPGQRPYCLFDYFPDDYLLVVDESHVTLPQVRAMYNGDRARKLNLVEHGFRLPSALDNRPMTFEEFEAKQNQVIYVSATPGDYELEQTGGVFVEQVIRPTGIPDPEIDIRPTEGQIDDLLEEVRRVIAKNERVLVTTLTKRMAEDLAEYLDSFGVKVRYLHSDIDALERVEILRGLRLGEFDVLVGVNLLREGLDLPEVSLVAILDADKEGFLRSDRSLIQTAGRAARNANSIVVMYADTITGSMERMMDETERRRAIQLEYNREHGIVPTTVKKDRDAIMRGTIVAEEKNAGDAAGRHQYPGASGATVVADPVVKYLTPEQKQDLVAQLTKEMLEASEALDFERAAELRDSIAQIEASLAA